MTTRILLYKSARFGSIELIHYIILYFNDYEKMLKKTNYSERHDNMAIWAQLIKTTAETTKSRHYDRFQAAILLMIILFIKLQ